MNAIGQWQNSRCHIGASQCVVMIEFMAINDLAVNYEASPHSPHAKPLKIGSENLSFREIERIKNVNVPR